MYIGGKSNMNNNIEKNMERNTKNKCYTLPKATIGAIEVYPVYHGEVTIAFGAIATGRVFACAGYDELLPLAVMDLQKEHPEIDWEPVLTFSNRN